MNLIQLNNQSCVKDNDKIYCFSNYGKLRKSVYYEVVSHFMVTSVH